jgi:hypothetical protein
LVNIFLLIVIPQIVSGCSGLGGIAMTPVEGIVRDAVSEEAVAGVSVTVRRLCCDGLDELGCGEGLTDENGEFAIIVPIIAESPVTDTFEIMVLRGACESVFALATYEDVSFVDLPFPRGFLFRITDPILVPACESAEDNAP